MPAKSIRPGGTESNATNAQRRDRWAWLPTALAILLISGAALLVSRLNALTFHHEQEAYLFARIHSHVQGFLALEGAAKQLVDTSDSILAEEWTEEWAASIAEMQEAFDRDIAAMAQLDADGAATLKAARDQYLADIAVLAQLVQDGDRAAADAWDEAHVDPSFAALLALVDEEIALHTRAAVTSVRVADAVSFGSLALVSVIGFSLYRRAQSARQETARVREAAESTQRLHERAMAAASCGIIITDARLPDNPIISVNPAFERMTGYAAAEVLGRNARVMQGPDTDSAAVTELRRLIEEEREGEVTLRNYRRDGSTYWSHIHIAPVRDEEGWVTQFVGIETDITEHYEAEAAIQELARYNRSLIDANLDMLLIVDAGGIIADANVATAKLLGVMREELIGRSTFDFVVDANSLRTALDLTLDAGEVRDVVLELLNRDGRIVPELCNATVHRDREEKIVGIVVAGRDITKRRQVELALIEAKEAAEEASRLKGQFLSMISHELRTPLNSILGFSYLMLDEYSEPLSPQQTADVQRIARGAALLLELVNNVLDFSRIEAGQLAVSKEALDLAPLLAQLEDQMGPMAAEKGLRLSAATPPDLPPALADRTRTIQILTNLVGNAVKFTEHGSITVSAREEAGMVAIDVRDTGIGIPPDGLSEIFEAFRQIDSSASRRFGGTGLGLTIARQLAELQMGSITVRSRQGEGSTFTLRLPIAEPGTLVAAAGTIAADHATLSVALPAS